MTMTSSMVPSNSKNKLPNTNYDIITNALIYKHINPPHYRMMKYNGRCNISCLGTVLSKMVRLNFDVQGKGRITQTFLYDIHNKIIKYKEFYYSEIQRKKDMKQKKKKSLKKPWKKRDKINLKKHKEEMSYYIESRREYSIESNF